MWVKICGITRAEDAAMVASSGVSAVGLNFYSASKRYVSRALAADLARAARENGRGAVPIDVVGVFVNSTLDDVLQTTESLALTCVQFHGDETADQIAEFRRRMPSTAVIRAVRISLANASRELASLAELHQRVGLSACLLDAFVPGEFGGTGVTIDPQIPELCASYGLPRLILAGGITSRNVQEFISRFCPWGIDTASGVESFPGIKDVSKCREFLRAVGVAEQTDPVRLGVCSRGL